MKKAIKLFNALFFAMVWASAQDIYFCGNGNNTGKIWKNDTLVYSLTDSLHINLQALQVISEESVYSAGFVHDTTYSQGYVWLNDSIVFSAGNNSIINNLIVNGEDWIAGGYNQNEWNLSQGVVWHNGEVLHTYSDPTISNRI